MGKAAQHLSTSKLDEIARDLFAVKSEKGGELIGLCPAHEDKTPSFSFNPSKDVCHCFSCGFKGDIITLWSKVKGSGDAKEDFKAFCKEYNISDDLDAPVPAKKKKKELPPLDDACQNPWLAPHCHGKTGDPPADPLPGKKER